MQGKDEKQAKSLHQGGKKMYKFERKPQISFTDFNQPQGLKMNEKNRWIKKAKRNSM